MPRGTRVHTEEGVFHILRGTINSGGFKIRQVYLNYNLFYYNLLIFLLTLYGIFLLSFFLKSSILFVISSIYSPMISIPINLLFSRIYANAVVPDPKKGSNTTLFSLVNNLINQDGSSKGNTALWFLFEHSVAKCNILDG